jgi:nicotinamidase-related amidase
MRVNREDSLLLVVDIQSRLAPHIAGHEALLRRTQALLDAAAMFAIPKLVTEHCPDQIGPVIESLRHRFATAEIFEKTCFGAADHPQFVELVRRAQRRQIVLTGMEAHVCVMQSALGLREHGFEVIVAADAVGSRQPAQRDREFALQRMVQSGCRLAGTETLLFEWAGSGTDLQFRNLLAIVKDL